MLDRKLRAEAGGILQWIIDGALAHQRDRLAPPTVVIEATANYFSAENLFQQWIDENCEVGPNYWEKPASLFNSWKRFAESANEKVGSKGQKHEDVPIARASSV